MGLFDKFFGAKYDPLDPTTEAARKVSDNAVLAEFLKTANDRVEVVPGDENLYAFVGKPPKQFGMVWFSDSERFDVRSQMEQGAITRDNAMRLVAQLTRIYEQSDSVDRYEHKVDGQSVIVTPSAGMYESVREAVDGAHA